MLLSMTGYGQSEYKGPSGAMSIEVKAFNHRFCEVKVRLPREYSLLEHRLIDFLKERCQRGSIEINLSKIASESAPGGFRVDVALASQWYRALKDVAQCLPLKEEGITLQDVLSCPNLIETSLAEKMDVEASWQSLLPTIEVALEQLQKMRKEEGANLEKDLLERGRQIEERIAWIQKESPAITQASFERMMARAKELLAQSPAVGTMIPLDRLAQELAIFAERADISEELVRAASHLKQWKETIRGAREPVGRKLEFLLQEIGRETNTIGSKAGSAELSHYCVEIKGLLEQMREQVQNIL